jgi:hypothetical protein
MNTVAPPCGLCIPVVVATDTLDQGIHDGDTIKLRPTWSQLTFPLRLIDCWCPEVQIRGLARNYPREKQQRILAAGHAARAALIQLLRPNPELRFAIPFDLVSNGNILELISFSRILGHLWANDIHVAEYLISKGHAFRTKEKGIAAGLA